MFKTLPGKERNSREYINVKLELAAYDLVLYFQYICICVCVYDVYVSMYMCTLEQSRVAKPGLLTFELFTYVCQLSISCEPLGLFLIILSLLVHKNGHIEHLRMIVGTKGNAHMENQPPTGGSRPVSPFRSTPSSHGSALRMHDLHVVHNPVTYTFTSSSAHRLSSPFIPF